MEGEPASFHCRARCKRVLRSFRTEQRHVNCAAAIRVTTKARQALGVPRPAQCPAGPLMGIRRRVELISKAVADMGGAKQEGATATSAEPAASSAEMAMVMNV